MKFWLCSVPKFHFGLLSTRCLVKLIIWKSVAYGSLTRRNPVLKLPDAVEPISWTKQVENLGWLIKLPP